MSDTIEERVRRLNPMDDIFFQKMAESKAFCREILRVFLEDSQLEVLEVFPQANLKNLQGRSVILDVYCQSADNKFINVEVQKNDDDHHQKRVRYNGACITTNVTETGVKFEKVPNVCVVYITKKDIFHSGKPMYHVDRIIRENGKKLDNGFTEVYVNAEKKDDTLASKLMTVFTEDEAYDTENFPETSKRKRHFKEDQKGVTEMSSVVEAFRMEGRTEGRTDILKKLVDIGKLSMEEAAQMLGVTVLTLEEMFAKMED